MTDYGFRSKCCNAPIRIGFKKIKRTKEKIKIWVCVKCLERNVDIVKYTRGESPEATSIFPFARTPE